MKNLKVALILVAVFWGYSAFASEPAISDVTVRQRWPWSKLVDIDYVLICDDTVDIVVNGFNGTVPLALPPSSLSGDCYNVSSGTRRIVWDPTATDYENTGLLSEFKVTLEAKPIPLYMIVDLTKAAGTDGQIDYVHESALRAGTWGSWVENPVTNRGTVIESIIWTGVTNDLIYATDKLVLRRVPAGSFLMGGNVLTTLTKPYYAGVFELTEAQWDKIMGGTNTTSKPKGAIEYYKIRGATTAVPAVNWPVTDRSVVTPSSFLGQLRLKTGLDYLDLPTEAQWEHLCKAGTTTAYNDGNAAAIVTGPNEFTNAWLDVLGWYEANSGKEAHPVGQKVANAWGLYDTLGNVSEYCLDWYSTAAYAGGNDPKGPTSSPESPLQRSGRSGNYASRASWVQSTTRAKFNPLWGYTHAGFRLVLTLP